MFSVLATAHGSCHRCVNHVGVAVVLKPYLRVGSQPSGRSLLAPGLNQQVVERAVACSEGLFVQHRPVFPCGCPSLSQTQVRRSGKKRGRSSEGWTAFSKVLETVIVPGGG